MANPALQVSMPGTQSYDNNGIPMFATTNTPVPSSASSVTVKPTFGRLFGVTVTTAGTVGYVLTDGPGGTIIFELTAAQAALVGTYPALPGGTPFLTSLIVVGAATNPSATVSFA